MLEIMEGAAHTGRIELYVLFPHLPFEGDQFNALTDQQFSLWYNRVWIPCLREFYDPTIRNTCSLVTS